MSGKHIEQSINIRNELHSLTDTYCKIEEDLVKQNESISKLIVDQGRLWQSKKTQLDLISKLSKQHKNVDNRVENVEKGIISMKNKLNSVFIMFAIIVLLLLMLVFILLCTPESRNVLFKVIEIAGFLIICVYIHCLHKYTKELKLQNEQLKKKESTDEENR